MAANEYLKAAAAQLQNAAQAMKKDVDSMRSDLMTHQRQATHEIDNMTMQMRALTARLASDNDDPAAVALSVQVQNLKKNIDEKKQELADHESNTNQVIQNKESKMADLGRQATNLQNQSADTALQ